MGAAAHLASDQPGVLQRLNMLRGGRERNGEWFRKLAYRSLAVGEFAKHLPAGGVPERMKDRIQARGLKFNHTVEYRGIASNSQPSG